MSFIPYVPNMDAWKNIQNLRGIKKFHSLQDGKGTPIQLVAPAEGAVMRAKLDLKRQLQSSPDHSPPRKRRKNITKSPKRKIKAKTKVNSKRKTIKRKKSTIKKK